MSVLGGQEREQTRGGGVSVLSAEADWDVTKGFAKPWEKR